MSTNPASSTKENDLARRFAKSADKLIFAVEVSVGAIFGWVELWPLMGEAIEKGIGKVIQGLRPEEAVWNATLVIYFFSWIFGTKRDAEVQGEVYLTAPNRGHLATQDIAVGVSIAIGFVVLLLLKTYPGWLAVALTLFWFGNIVAWRYLVKLLTQPIDKSRLLYTREKEYIGLAKLHIVERYISGRWQWWRFVLGGVLIVAVDVTAFFEHIDTKMGLIVFVAVVECWVWLERARTELSLNVLEDFGDRYGKRLGTR